MNEQMNGNPYECLAQDDPRNPCGTAANAVLALAWEQRITNLIAIYNSPNLVQYLSDAARIDLEKTILQRAGLKDA